MDLKKLDQAFEYASRSSQHGGLLVVRHGWLVFERHYGRGHREANQAGASVEMMLAEKRAAIPEGLATRVFNEKYLPQAMPVEAPVKAGITLGVGTASSGASVALRHFVRGTCPWELIRATFSGKA